MALHCVFSLSSYARFLKSALCAILPERLVRRFALATGRTETKLVNSGPDSKLEALAIRSCFRKNQEINRQGQRAENWFRVLRGGARRSILRRDGKRQIVGFLLPGDFFGVATGEAYDFSTESIIEGTIVSSYLRRSAEALADSDPDVAREIRSLVLSVIAQLQNQLLIMGRTTATEKVNSFLVDMSHRLPNHVPGGFLLPVSRYDIADYLGISAETVSRSFSRLNARGVISFNDQPRAYILNTRTLETDHRPTGGAAKGLASIKTAHQPISP
jgi:CRP-like cAMP-binding protein